MNATPVVASRTGLVTPAAPTLTVRGVEKAYRRGVWPARRLHQVLRVSI